MTKVFKFYHDSKHGFLAVKRQLLEDLGLMNSISVHSRVNGKTFYLEEDADMTVFKNAYELRFGTLETVSIDHGDRSWVRNYSSVGDVVLPGAVDEVKTLLNTVQE